MLICGVALLIMGGATAASSSSLSAIFSQGAQFKWGSDMDCHGMSSWLYDKLTAAGYKARIIQYPTSLSSNHQSVQYMVNGAWVDVPYRSYGFDPLFDNTQSSGTVVAEG